MRRVYFTRVSAQLLFVTGIKQQPLPQLATGHVKLTVFLDPQGTLVTSTKTKHQNNYTTEQNLEPIEDALEGLQESLVAYEEAAKRANNPDGVLKRPLIRGD
jgi:hypothetical protein